MWLTISHNPGVLNSEADKRSRKFHDQTEWKLDPNILKQLAEKVVCPDVDLFASRLNCQSHPFISWGQDPDPALAVDTFTVNWSRWAVIYAFPPFSLIQKTLASRGATHCATLAYSSVVSKDPETADTNTNPFAAGEESFSVGPLRRSSSSTQTASTSSSLLTRKAVHAPGIHGRTCEIICASQMESTKKQYASYLYRWNQFCASGNSETLRPTVAPVLEFLTKLLDEELGYSAINTARSAISAVTQTAVGSQPQITKFLKGVFELRTPLPKYTHTWDDGILLDYFRKQKCNVELSLKELTKQLAALFSSFV